MASKSPIPISPAISGRRSTQKTSTISKSSAAATIADVGDRTYGVFNVVPRTGFDRNNRRANSLLRLGNFWQTNDQLNFGNHTEKFAYYASLNGTRSNYGLAPPIA